MASFKEIYSFSKVFQLETPFFYFIEKKISSLLNNVTERYFYALLMHLDRKDRS